MNGDLKIDEGTDINSLCRTCLNKHNKMFPIFQSYDNSTTIHEIIMKICFVEIKPDDGLPENICMDCIHVSKEAFSFKNRCEEVQDVLKEYQSRFINQHLEINLKEEPENYDFDFYNNEDIKPEDKDILKDCDDKANIDNVNTNCVKTEELDDVPGRELLEYNIAFSSKDKIKCEIFKTKPKKIKPNKQIILDTKERESTKDSEILQDGLSDNTQKFLQHCSYCNFKTRWASTFKRHISIHTNEKNFSCDSCEYRCSRPSSLRIHKLIHAPEKPYKCKDCEYQCSDSSNFKRHVKTHSQKKPYECKTCPYRCARLDYLRKHLRTHTGERPFLCDQCHYTASCLTSLKAHKVNKHSQVWHFTCNDCNFKSKSKSNLVSHLRIHSGEKKYVCDICPYTANYLDGLKRHKMMVHTKERPFPCDQCSYKAISTAYLKIHRRVHLSIKSFACDVCPLSFHTKYRLKSHKWTHSGEKPYCCTLCQYKSASSSSLRKHEKRIHNHLNLLISKQSGVITLPSKPAPSTDLL